MTLPLARIVGTVALTGALALGVAVPALADGTSTPAATPTASSSPSPSTHVTVDGNTVTITTDLATVQAWCTRDQKAQARLTALQQRIQAGADTKGSVAWLRAKAAAAATAGHPEQAKRLNERADRRQDRLPQIANALTRLKNADTTVCSALPGAGA